MEPSPGPISEATISESIAEHLALTSGTVVAAKEMEPLSPVLRTEIIKDIEWPTSALEPIPFKAEVPIQDDLEAPVAEPAPIAWKESAVLIVEEPSLQKDIAPEHEVTPTTVESEGPIIKESLTQENVALEMETTLPSGCYRPPTRPI